MYFGDIKLIFRMLINFNTYCEHLGVLQLGLRKKYHVVMESEIKEEIKISAGDIDIRVDCEVHGNIMTKGKILIGKKGKYFGDLKSRKCVIYGKVFGNIKVDEEIYIDSKAEVKGNMECIKIHTSESDLFNGGGRTITEDEKIVEDGIANKKNIEESKKQVKDEIKCNQIHNSDQSLVNSKCEIIDDKDIKHKTENTIKDNIINIIKDESTREKNIKSDTNNDKLKRRKLF